MRHLFWLYGIFLIFTVSREVNGELKTPLSIMTQKGTDECSSQDNFSLSETGCGGALAYLDFQVGDVKGAVWCVTGGGGF